MHRCQHLVHPSEQFWNWFCGMAFRASVVLLLMSSVSSNAFLSIFPLSSGTENSHWGLDLANTGRGGSSTVICLLAKNSLIDSSLIQALTFLRWHTKTHSDNNRCHSERDCHRSAKHSCETLTCQRHQTILRFLSIAAMASTWWWVHELYCQTSYVKKPNNGCWMRKEWASVIKEAKILRWSYSQGVSKCCSGMWWFPKCWLHFCGNSSLFRKELIGLWISIAARTFKDLYSSTSSSAVHVWVCLTFLTRCTFSSWQIILLTLCPELMTALLNKS
jgi:hypothetical protein